MIRHVVKLVVVGVLAALVGVACALSFRQPVVRFDGLRLGGVGVRGATLFAQLQVSNPNRYRLETAALTYNIEVSDAPTSGQTRWSPLASGTFDEPIRVDSRDSTVVEIPIEFGFSELGGALRSVMDRGTFDYRLSGTITVRDPIRRQFPYRRTGTISLAGVK